MNSMAQLKQALLAYIGSLDLHSISKFLQHSPGFVNEAEYYMKYTPISVQDEKEVGNIEDTKILKSILEILEEIKEKTLTH